MIVSSGDENSILFDYIQAGTEKATRYRISIFISPKNIYWTISAYAAYPVFIFIIITTIEPDDKEFVWIENIWFESAGFKTNRNTIGIDRQVSRRQ
jgi:hypothetical protein